MNSQKKSPLEAENSNSYQKTCTPMITHSGRIASRQFRFSYNPLVKNKTKAYKDQARGYIDTEGTLNDVVSIIKKGYAINNGLFADKKQCRNNWVGSHWVILEVDNKVGGVYHPQLSIQQALEHPFVQKHCGLIYTSPNHAENWHRFRMIFPLPEFCSDLTTYEKWVERVASELPHDKNARKIDQPFYGNTQAIFPLVNPKACLSLDLLQTENKASETQPKHGYKPDSAQKKKVLEALKYIPRREPGRGNHHECVAVLHALVAEFGTEEAFNIADTWSPTGIHPDWVLEKQIQYCSKPRFIHIGKLFQIAAQYGYKTKESNQQTSIMPVSLQQQVMRNKYHQAWLDARKFTADIEINERYLDPLPLIDEFKTTDILAIRSAMGTGKTEFTVYLLRYVKELLKGVIAVGSRNALLLQLCKRWSEAGSTFGHIQEDKESVFVQDTLGWIACCSDSLHKFEDHHFDNRLLILDEATSTVIHTLLSGTIKKAGRQKILKKWEQVIGRAWKILLLDGNLNDEVVEYIKEVRLKYTQNASVKKVKNLYPAPRLNIELISAIDEEGELKKTNYTPITEGILRTLESTKHRPIDEANAITVIADNQKLLETYDRIFTELGYRVLRIDRITAALKETKEIIKDINNHLEENHYDALLLSPTVEMGLDVSVKNYFNKCFALFFGVISTDSQLQFLRRIRNCHDWAIYCADFNRFASKDTVGMDKNKVEKYLCEYLLMDASITLDEPDHESLLSHIKETIFKTASDIHSKYAFKLISRLSYERQNTRFCLTEILSRQNSLREICLHKNDPLYKSVKETKKEIKQERALARFNAPDISLEEAKEIMKSFSSSQDDVFAAEKCLLKDRLPGIELSNLWNADYFEKYFENGGRQEVKTLERYWLLKNLDVAKQLNRKNWKSIATETTWIVSGEKPVIEVELRNFYTHDLRMEHAELACIQRLGIPDLVGEEGITEDDERIKGILSSARYSKSNQAALKRKVGKSTPIEFVGRMMASIGVKSKGKVMSKDKDGKQKRSYSYQDPYEQEESKTLLECIARKFIGKAEDFCIQVAPIVIPDVPDISEWLSGGELRNMYNMWLHTFFLDNVEEREEARYAIKKIIFKMWETENRKTTPVPAFMKANPTPPF